MNKLSVEDLLKELAKEPKTFGCDAVLAFDRSMTNNLLMQEYIDRFGSDSYFPPLNSEIETHAGLTWHQMRGFMLDKPRLSFENASISDSKARLTLRIVGGKQLEINQSLGSTVKRLTRLAAANPLHGPSLIFDIDLKKVTGSVDSAGRVVLDLSQGTSYTFTGVDTALERTKMGEHFKQLFESWDDDKKVFELNELKVKDDDLVQPGNFVIRTHPAPGATLVRSEDFGKGAVLLFISMKGREGGSPPIRDEQLPYLLPDAEPPFSANMLLSHEYLLEHVLFNKFDELEGLERLEFELQNDVRGPFKKLVAKSGDWLVAATWDEEEVDKRIRRCSSLLSKVSLASQTPLSFEIKETASALEAVWEGVFTPNCSVFDSGRGGEGQQSARADVPIGWKWNCSYKFEVVEDELGKRLVFRAMPGENLSLTFDFPSDFNQGRLPPTTAKLKQLLDENISRRFASITAPLLHASIELDAFRLNSLLFRTHDVVQFRESHWPGDLTLLSDLAPDRTAFAVVPQEKILLAGATHMFTVEPSTPGVKWSVANLPDEQGNPGSIDPDTGNYQAPAVADLDGDFRRVVVTASTADVTNKSLVSVVARDVSVYPMVVTVGFSGKYTVSASTVDGSPLTWRMGDGALGALETDPNPDPNVQDSRIYVAPASAPPFVPDKPYHEYVIRMDQIQVSRPSAPAQPIDVLIPIAQSSSYWLEAEAEGDSVQLRFFNRNARGVVIEVPQEQARWYLVRGEGDVVDGLFTPQQNSTQLFAVIVAMRNPEEDYEEGEYFRFATMIVPVPFVSSEDFVALLKHAPKEA
ncbi:hypothetical protein [Pseudomonas sp. NPDC089396]|uniref:hypothetical protein n=1 Tax=Pseudomonas sp. NPDC089396 TaxID=3364461 RepID=UPI00383562BC